MLNTILLDAAANAGGGLGSTVIMVVLMLAIIYFFFIAPQSKEQKRLAKLRDGLKKGDKVLTNSGIIGKVCDVKDDCFVIEVADGVKVRFVKSAVIGEAPEAQPKKDDKKEN